jgi:hypothetical protein
MALILGIGASGDQSGHIAGFLGSDCSRPGTAAGMALGQMDVSVRPDRACILWPLADWVVKLLFQRGAFSEANTAQVAELLQLLLLQVPFYFFGLVMVSALSSRKDSSR